MFYIYSKYDVGTYKEEIRSSVTQHNVLGGVKSVNLDTCQVKNGGCIARVGFGFKKAVSTSMQFRFA